MRLELIGRLPTLPHTCACSTIGAEGLNFRVRDGNGWVPLAMVTQKLVVGLWLLVVGRKPRGARPITNNQEPTTDFEH